MFFLKNYDKNIYLDKAKEYGQEKLFCFYEELTPEQQGSLVSDIEKIDFNHKEVVFLYDMLNQ